MRHVKGKGRLGAARYFVVEFEAGAVVAITAQVCPALTARDPRLATSLAAPRLARLDNHISLLITRLTIESRDNLPWFIFHAHMLPHAQGDCKRKN